MAHIGVKNRTDKAQALTYNGKPIYFKAGEIKIVSDVPADHIEGRILVQHKTQTREIDGKTMTEQLPILHGVKLFDIVPLAEALRMGATPDEDPQVIALREAAEAKVKERKALMAEIKEDLIASGWQKPSEKKEKASKVAQEA